MHSRRVMHRGKQPFFHFSSSCSHSPKCFSFFHNSVCVSQPIVCLTDFHSVPLSTISFMPTFIPLPLSPFTLTLLHIDLFLKIPTYFPLTPYCMLTSFALTLFLSSFNVLSTPCPGQSSNALLWLSRKGSTTCVCEWSCHDSGLPRCCGSGSHGKETGSVAGQTLALARSDTHTDLPTEGVTYISPKLPLPHPESPARQQ